MGHLHGPRRGYGLQGQDDRGAPRPAPELLAAYTAFRALVRGWRRGSGHFVEVRALAARANLGGPVRSFFRQSVESGASRSYELRGGRRGRQDKEPWDDAIPDLFR